MELAKVVQRMKQAQNDLNEIELMKEGDLHHVEKSYNDLLVQDFSPEGLEMKELAQSAILLVKECEIKID